MSKTNYPPEAAKQIEELLAENKLMRQLATADGFYEYFFSQLKKPEYRTNVECFHACNEKYFEIFGDWRYSCYQSFMKSNQKRNK